MPDAESYRVFWPLLRPIVASYHSAHGRKLSHPRSDWPQPKRVDDFDGARVRCVLFEVRRNLAAFPMLTRMDAPHFNALERAARAAFGRMDGEHSGNYYAVPTGMTAKVRRDLEEADALFSDDDGELRAGGAYERWPHGRGVFAAHDRRVHVRVCDSDHFRFRCRRPDGKFRSAYEHFRRSLDHWHEKLREVLAEQDLTPSSTAASGDNDEVTPAWHEKLGFITLSPAHLGTALLVRHNIMISCLYFFLVQTLIL